MDLVFKKSKFDRNSGGFGFGEWMSKGIRHRRLALYGFSQRNWRIINLRDETKITPLSLKRITVITYNVWFGKYQDEKRFQSQCEIFKTENAEIICLQEVNKSFMSVISKNRHIRQHYYASDNPHSPTTFNRYGVIQLIRKDLLPGIVSLKKLILPSKMARAMVHVDLCFEKFSLDDDDDDEKKNQDSFKLNIGTVHLESMSQAELRRVQLMKISNHVQKKCSNAILVGDFNFDDETNYAPRSFPIENDFLKHKSSKDWNNYIDIWEHLQLLKKGPTTSESGIENNCNKGKTFDTDTNPMIYTRLGRKKVENPRREVMRYDRMMLKSEFFVPLEIRMLGTKILYEIVGSKTGEDGKKLKFPVLPSDHFGLCCTFEVKEK